MPHIEPVSGWSLSYIVALDMQRPGVAGEFFRASAERRQVIAALLSTKPEPPRHDEASELAKLIGEADHGEILTAAFGNVPCGLRGALARSGPQPHPRSFYRVLFQLLSSPEARVRPVIKQLTTLDLMRLRIVQLLPADVCTANLVELMGSVRMASDVAKLIELLTKGGIDRRALTQALGRVCSDHQLAELWDRWTQKLNFPPHPVPASELYIPIQNGAELRRLALRYRNCARRYLSQVLDGEDAFAEFGVGPKRAVIHLSKADGVWVLQGLFGKDNGMVAPEVRSAAVAYLTDQGVRSSNAPRNRGGEWAVLRRLSRAQMFGF